MPTEPVGALPGVFSLVLGTATMVALTHLGDQAGDAMAVVVLCDQRKTRVCQDRPRLRWRVVHCDLRGRELSRVGANCHRRVADRSVSSWRLLPLGDWTLSLVCARVTNHVSTA
jgi:hypothetical protein